MTDNTAVLKCLKYEEKAIYAMRALYRQYGYAQYKMSKFEEYDLYARNKDFLVSDNVITFTDTDGRLMALKPDVTLSIVRNYREKDGLCKVCYNENVYRRCGSTHAYREIMQVGLEYLGTVDLYALGEVAMLAMRSLTTISPHAVLALSHMGLVRAVLDASGADASDEAEILTFLREKNLHGMEMLCRERGLDTAPLRLLLETHGSPQTVLPTLQEKLQGAPMREALAALSAVCKQLEQACGGAQLRIDFSIINDMNYYNGLLFQGYIDGLPQAVLSGGQYDNLMIRMKKAAGAVGFAVYLDQLQRFGEEVPANDADVLLLYRPEDDCGQVAQTVARLTAQGQRVFAAPSVPEKMTFGTKIVFSPEV